MDFQIKIKLKDKNTLIKTFFRYIYIYISNKILNIEFELKYWV